MEQHIGVGAATRVDEIHIRWPASYTQEQVLRNFAVDQALLVREGVPAVQEVRRNTFILGASPLPMTMQDHK
jgi:hypothetical protein